MKCPRCKEVLNNIDTEALAKRSGTLSCKNGCVTDLRYSTYVSGKTLIKELKALVEKAGPCRHCGGIDLKEVDVNPHYCDNADYRVVCGTCEAIGPSNWRERCK